MISITKRAGQRLKDILTQRCLDVGLGFRVIRNAEDPDRVSLGIKLDNEREGDDVIELHGIKIFLDQEVRSLVINHQLDCENDPTGGFVLKTMKHKTA